MINAIGNYIGRSAGNIVAGLVNTFTSRVEADGGVVESESCLLDRITTLKNLGLWDKASAVWLPHGYKEGKLYAVKGGSAADLTITRAGTRTRKGPTYVEQVPYNLLSRSEEFDNAAWTKTNSTITADSIAGPKGRIVDTMLETVTNGAHDVRQSVTKGALSIQYTVSAYCKGNGRGWARLAGFSGSNSVRQWFDLTNGVVGSSDLIGSGWAKQSATITEVENGFYRCVFTFTSDNTTTVSVAINSTTDDLISTFAGDTIKGLYIYGAQLVEGSSALDYLPTTDRFNVPALDYTNDTCPALSLEPARTNLLLRSEEFDTASWVKTLTTITADAIISPNGLTTADLITNSNAGASTLQTVTITANATYTLSFFVKYSNSGFVKVEFRKNSEQLACWINPSTGEVSGTVQAGLASGVTSSVKNYGNGWYRVSLTGALNNGHTSVTAGIYPTNAVSSSSTSAGQAVYVWGAQLTAESYVTSYIPTTSASVTKIADSVSALTGISSSIGQTEGTIYFKGSSFADSTAKFISLSDGTTGNRVTLGFSVTNKIQVVIASGGVTVVNIETVGVFVTNQVYDICFKWSGSRAALFLDGALVGEDTSLTLPISLDQLIFNSTSGSGSVFYGNIENLSIVPTALSDSEAIALTA